jgi:hypothetical protein
MRFGWYSLAVGIVLAIGSVATVRYGFAVSENARLLAMLVMSLSLGVALISVMVNITIMMDMWLTTRIESIEKRKKND